MLAAPLALIPALILEADASGAWLTAAVVANWLIWIIAIGLMLVGIGFISVLTAAVASRFVAQDSGADEVLETLRRIEADVAELKMRVSTS